MKKTKVQIVGNYYAPALNGKLPENICVQNICCGISPLTLCGEPDKQVESEWENKIRDLNQWAETPSNSVYLRQSQELFDIKKNFGDFLSRDKDIFCDNTVFSLLGKETVLKNEADYIIIDNSAAFRGLAQFNGVLYTKKWPATPFTKFLSKQPSVINIYPWESDDSFNWKYYFDKFIDTVLSHYKSFQIILIRSPYSKYYYENEKINIFEKLQPKQKNFINKLDDYFIERTGCFVINSLCNIVPMKFLNPHGYPYGNGYGKWMDDIVYQISKIIKGTTSSTCDEQTFMSPVAKLLYKRIRKDKQKELSDLILKAENQRAVTMRKIITDDSSKLLRIDFFIEKNFYTLSDYIEETTDNGNKPDLSLIEIYTEYLNVDLNDILTIYMLYSSDEYPDKSVFDAVIVNLFSSVSSEPIKKTDDLFYDNIQFLNDYPYMDKTCLADVKIDKKYIQICDDTWLVLDVSSTHSIYIIQNIFENDLDCEEIINNGYVCDIQHAEALTYSYKYYIEKARKGDGAVPTLLNFKSNEDFYCSLQYVNYTDLLKNERFVFNINNLCNISINEFSPIVDLTELIDPNLITVKLQAGLGDQICRYVLGEMIAKQTGREVIYDDLNNSAFSGIEVLRFAKRKGGVLSEILSDRLKDTRIFKNLYYNISDQYNYMTYRYDLYQSEEVECSCTIHGANIKPFVEDPRPYLYYNSLIRIENIMECYNIQLGDFIEFPTFDKPEHIKLSKEILSFDSIIVHVRRGDYATWGWDTDTDFYKEAIATIWKVNDLNNKKLFVFSDDINWCKENKSDIGLNNLGETEVIFVEGNKGEDSFRDIQLMSLGKVMICGASYFARIAILYGQRWEIIAAANAGKYTGKYNLGAYSKNYRTNYSRHQPKQ